MPPKKIVSDPINDQVEKEKQTTIALLDIEKIGELRFVDQNGRVWKLDAVVFKHGTYVLRQASK